MASAVYCNSAYGKEGQEEEEVYEEVIAATSINNHNLQGHDATAAKMQTSSLQQGLASKTTNSSRIVPLSISLAILAFVSAAVALTVALIQVSSMKMELNTIREQSVTGATINNTLEKKLDEVSAELLSVLGTVDDMKVYMTSMNLTVQLNTDRIDGQIANASLQHLEYSDAQTRVDDQLRTMANQLVGISENISDSSSQVLGLEQVIANITEVSTANSVQLELLRNQFLAASQKTCFHPYILNPVSSTCIRLVTVGTNWQTAKASCEDSGEYLAVFDTLPSVEWIHQLRQAADTPSEWRERLWVGLRDINGWRWQGIETDPISTSDPIWHSGQPNENVAACGYLYTSTSDKIWDASCTKSYSYICEKL